MQPITDFQWRYAADTVMGGVSEGQAVIQEGVLRLTGNVSTANNGGFIQARTDLPEGIAGDTVHLRVRGNGERYFVSLRSLHAQRPWQSYRAAFETNGDWTDIALPLSAFERTRDTMPVGLAAQDVRSLGLLAYGHDHQADLSVSHLSFSGA